MVPLEIALIALDLHREKSTLEKIVPQGLIRNGVRSGIVFISTISCHINTLKFNIFFFLHFCLRVTHIWILWSLLQQCANHVPQAWNIPSP